MWSPTHIQVTVLRAKGLLTKGKNATNNCFVTIGLGKEKYQTSLKEKVPSNVDWHEECELKIPDQGNRAELVLTCLHRNNLGIDEFLGQAILPLNEMDVYDRPRSRWFKLESKPGKEKKKERGELEVRISFIVKSGSLTDLRKKEKHKSSVGQLASSVGGSLLSIGTIEKRKSLSKIARSIGSKMHLPGTGGGGGSGKKKKNKENDSDSFTGSFSSIETPNSGRRGRYGQRIGEADPGVISEDEDEFVFDNLSHKSSGSSLNIRSGLQNYNAPIASSPVLLHGKEDESLRSRILPPSKPPRNAANESPPKVDEWEAKLYGKHGMDGSGGGGGLGVGGTDSLKRRSWETSRVPLPQNNNNSSNSNNNSAEETEETESARDFKEAVEAEEKLQAAAASDMTTTTPTTTTTAFKESVLARASLDRESKSTTETPFSTPQKETKFFPEIKQRRLENLVHGSGVDQQSSTAPSTPVSRRSNDDITSPQAFIEAEKQSQKSQKSAMPRSATMECLSQKDSAPIAVPTSFSASNSNLAKDDKDAEKEFTPPTAAAAVGKTTEKRNRFSKYKYFNKRDKNDFNFDDNNYSPIPSERIIIGHEKSSSHVPRSEISAALEKKYDGKSREELMIIAHGMETEALIQRQRVKELEDYLDNLLLRVMETHPKILQNPYSQRTTLAKSG